MQKRGQVQIALKLSTLEERERERELEVKFISRATSVGEPDALSSSGSDERRNQFGSSMFKYADPSKLGRSLLEGNKDHLLSQARSELMKQEYQVGSLKIDVSLSFSNKLMLKDWNCKTLIKDMLNLEDDKLDYMKTYL